MGGKGRAIDADREAWSIDGGGCGERIGTDTFRARSGSESESSMISTPGLPLVCAVFLSQVSLAA